MTRLINLISNKSLGFFAERIAWHFLNGLRIDRPHPSFHLLPSITIGPDTHLGSTARVHVYEKEGTLTIGARCAIDGLLILERAGSSITIGDDVSIGDRTLIHAAQSVIIENHVLIADEVIIRDHDAHGLYFNQRREERIRGRRGENRYWEVVQIKPVVIEEGVWIATRSIILKGVHIGKGAVIGAGSVVSKNVPAWSVVAGNPTQIIKQLTPEA